MGASRLVSHVYREHIENYGEPSSSIRFDRPGDNPVLEVLDVFIWRADAENDVTTFATIGMSERELPQVDHRAELHFAVRRTPSPQEESDTARFLANLAAYPFLNGVPFDWWHTLSQPGSIPMFPSCSAILLHPAFVPEGWETIEFEGVRIKILNVVPITEKEKELLADKGVRALLEYFAEADIDLLQDRTAG